METCSFLSFFPFNFLIIIVIMAMPCYLVDKIMTKSFVRSDLVTQVLLK